MRGREGRWDGRVERATDQRQGKRSSQVPMGLSRRDRWMYGRREGGRREKRPEDGAGGVSVEGGVGGAASRGMSWIGVVEEWETCGCRAGVGSTGEAGGVAAREDVGAWVA